MSLMLARPLNPITGQINPSSPKDLADYLKYLDKHDELFKEYLAWKKRPPNKNFLKLQKTSPRTGPCRLCLEVARMQAERMKGV
jgi:hypothetical protein